MVIGLEGGISPESSSAINRVNYLMLISLSEWTLVERRSGHLTSDWLELEPGCCSRVLLLPNHNVN